MQRCTGSVLVVLLVLVVAGFSSQAFAASRCPAMARDILDSCSLQAAAPGTAAATRELKPGACTKLIKKFRKSCGIKRRVDSVCLAMVDPVCAVNTQDLLPRTYSNYCVARFFKRSWPVYKGVCR